MEPEQLARFGRLIQEKLAQARGELEEFERISRSQAAQESAEDRSAYSLHMADRGTDAMEREKTLLFAQRSDDYIEYLQEALQRVQLEAVPTATQCIECKSKQEGLREAS
jgi:RNA polymerase-binding transcription factor DksA